LGVAKREMHGGRFHEGGAGWKVPGGAGWKVPGGGPGCRRFTWEGTGIKVQGRSCQERGAWWKVRGKRCEEEGAWSCRIGDAGRRCREGSVSGEGAGMEANCWGAEGMERATIWKGGGGRGPMEYIVSGRKLMGDVIMRSGIKLLVVAGPNN